MKFKDAKVGGLFSKNGCIFKKTKSTVDAFHGNAAKWNGDDWEPGYSFDLNDEVDRVE